MRCSFMISPPNGLPLSCGPEWRGTWVLGTDRDTTGRQLQRCVGRLSQSSRFVKNKSAGLLFLINSRQSVWSLAATVQDAVFDGLTIEQRLWHDVCRNPKSRLLRAASKA